MDLKLSSIPAAEPETELLSAGQKVARCQRDFDTATFCSSNLDLSAIARRLANSYRQQQDTKHERPGAMALCPQAQTCVFRNTNTHNTCFFFFVHMEDKQCKVSTEIQILFFQFPRKSRHRPFFHSKTKEQRKPQDVKSELFKPSTQAPSKDQILPSVSEQLVRPTKITKEGCVLPFISLKKKDGFFFFSYGEPK